jgi:hypothetical protein
MKKPGEKTTPRALPLLLRGKLLLELIDLHLRVLKRMLLDENRLRQQIRRVRLRGDTLLDQLLRRGIPASPARALESLKQSVNQFTLCSGHMGIGFKIGQRSAISVEH